MSSNIVYLGRDNVIVWELLQNNKTVQEDAITHAKLWIPEELTDVSEPIVASTDPEEDMYDGLKLIDNDTKIEARLGSLPLKKGYGMAFLTVYDSDHPNGIAWGGITLIVKDWPTEEK